MAKRRLPSLTRRGRSTPNVPAIDARDSEVNPVVRAVVGCLLGVALGVAGALVIPRRRDG